MRRDAGNPRNDGHALRGHTPFPLENRSLCQRGHGLGAPRDDLIAQRLVERDRLRDPIQVGIRGEEYRSRRVKRRYTKS